MLGNGEEIGAKMDNVMITHGLLSLVDSFSYQPPVAPEAVFPLPSLRDCSIKALQQGSTISS